MNLENLEHTRLAANRTKQEEARQEHGDDVQLVMQLPDGTVAEHQFPAGVTVAYVKMVIEQQHGHSATEVQLLENGRPLMDPYSLWLLPCPRTLPPPAAMNASHANKQNSQVNCRRYSNPGPCPAHNVKLLDGPNCWGMRRPAAQHVPAAAQGWGTRSHSPPQQPPQLPRQPEQHQQAFQGVRSHDHPFPQRRNAGFESRGNRPQHRQQSGGKGRPGPGSDFRRPPAPPAPFKMVLKRPAEPPSPDDNKLPTGLAVTWLGTSSGAPTLERNVSCTVVRNQQETVLVDCGEGSARQLQAAGMPVNKINNIYVTHLHGDHCFGLGNTLLAIDRAKVSAAHQQLSEQGIPVPVDDPQQQVAVLREACSPTYVWGPPGTAELVYAQLVLPGTDKWLVNDVLITELVVDAADAVTQPQLMSSTCHRIAVRRLAGRPMSDTPSMMQAVQLVTPALDCIPQVFVPWQSHGRRLVPRLPSDRKEHTHPEAAEHEAAMYDVTYGGRNYIAQEGLMWHLVPPATSHTGQRSRDPPGLHCKAAQLQHRVPCWGFVFREASPAAPGVACRKVVILGDTVNSRPIAPLALGCDLLAHEATFTQGMEDKCRRSQHSTGWMAGSFAAAVQTRLLVLTHFSARYANHTESYTPGPKMRERELSHEEELAEQNRAIQGLVHEAQVHYQGQILAASDLYTLHVPCRPAPPTNRQQAVVPGAMAQQVSRGLMGQQGSPRTLVTV